MTLTFDTLNDSPRLLIEVELQPVQGTRFQPTGFPEIGAAEYSAPDGESRMILVESAQSMANRLEAVCWDEADDKLVPTLDGIPYFKSKSSDGVETNSILEAHRCNSPYIVNSDVFDSIKEEIGFDGNKPFNPRKQLAPFLLKYDTNALLHGIFLEKIGGVVRIPRILSSFIEASDTQVAASGGVKFDRVKPEKGAEGKTAKEGYGNVPYPRDEYVSPKITAYFNLDLAQLRGYGFSETVNALLIALSLYKIRRFLETGLRLRTACDLDIKENAIKVTRPSEYRLPELSEFESSLPSMISAVSKEGVFADPAVTEVTYRK
jgi:CRISPR-associated protein Csb1